MQFLASDLTPANLTVWDSWTNDQKAAFCQWYEEQIDLGDSFADNDEMFLVYRGL